MVKERMMKQHDVIKQKCEDKEVISSSYDHEHYDVSSNNKKQIRYSKLKIGHFQTQNAYKYNQNAHLHINTHKNA